jgi:hypothetical protein
VEVSGALLSIVVVLVPSLASWVDSVAYRNRVQGRAALIRARRGEQSRQHGEEPGNKPGRSLD